MAIRSSNIVRLWALAIGPWALVGLLGSAVLFFFPFLRGQPSDPLWALAHQVPETLFWTAITPLLVFAARRYRVRLWLPAFAAR